jgi:hypothetical protein
MGISVPYRESIPNEDCAELIALRVCTGHSFAAVLQVLIATFDTMIADSTSGLEAVKTQWARRYGTGLTFSSNRQQALGSFRS